MAKKAAQDERDFFVVRTLFYEVWMMRETHRLLCEGKQPQVLVNALIESFCIHARNLIGFFKNKDCDFNPKWFTTKGYQLKTRFVGDSVLPRINKQIAHVSRDRITLVSDKIDNAERERISAAIEDELARFRQHLSPEYLDKWKVPARRYIVAAPFAQELTTGTPTVVVGREGLSTDK